MASSAPSLKQLFSDKCNFTVDENLAKQIIRWKVLYTTRDTHPEALNTPLLGCAKLGFYPKDSQALFDMLRVNRNDAKLCVRQSVIDNNFKVASNEFNLMCVWAAHKFLTDTKLKPELKTSAALSLFYMLIVSFFSSLCRHFLKYSPNKAVMEATIDSLTDKFDIKKPETGTWNLVIEARAKELVTPGNIHWDALSKFEPDMGSKSIVYVLSDVQTRLRNKIRAICEIYYDLVKNSKGIQDSDITTTDSESGDKVIKELKNSFEGMIANICARVINAQSFLRSDYVKIASKLVPNVRADLMRNMLLQFSSIAVTQYQKQKQDEVTKDGLFIGYRILVTNIIQRTYRLCILSKVDMKSRLAILKKTLDLFRSSRVNDPIVVKIKETLDKFVTDCKLTQRDATKASLKIAFAVYIILMSFDCD